MVSANNLYQRRQRNDSIADIQRYARIVLEKIPYEPEWWRVPKEQAPQQLGWNICPLKFKPGTVSATLAGYVNPERGSDWRAGFVGVDRARQAGLRRVFGPGKAQSFDARPNLKELYLVVCAMPTNIMAIDMVGDFRSFEQEPFPYKVKLAGCEPLDVLMPETPTVEGAPHPNGGGFVAKSAQVEPSAYVGPDAQVLGNSKVLGNARIEDHAVVQQLRRCRIEAVVSGHALGPRGLGRRRASQSTRLRGGQGAQHRARTTRRILEHAAIALAQDLRRQCRRQRASRTSMAGTSRERR